MIWKHYCSFIKLERLNFAIIELQLLFSSIASLVGQGEIIPNKKSPWRKETNHIRIEIKLKKFKSRKLFLPLFGMMCKFMHFKWEMGNFIAAEHQWCVLCGQGGRKYNIPVAAFAHLRKLHLKHSDYIIEPQETLQWFPFSGTKYLLFFSSESFSSLATLNRRCRSSHRKVFAVHTPAHTHTHTRKILLIPVYFFVCVTLTRICALIWIFTSLIKYPSLTLTVYGFRISYLIWYRIEW